MAPGEGLDDPALRRATSREQWHVGSAVEIFSNTDRRWNIGWVVQEDPLGNVFHVLFNDGEGPHLKCKSVRRDDQQLEPVGTNLRKLPMYFELAPDGSLLQRTTNRRCSTFEEAWRVHYEVYLRDRFTLPEIHMPAAQPGGLTVRGHVQIPPGALPQLSAQPVPTQTAVLATSGGFNVSPAGGPETQVNNNAGGSFCAQVVPGAPIEPPPAEKISRLQQSLEENERQAEEARQQAESLAAELAAARKELEETRAERDRALRRCAELETLLDCTGSPGGGTGSASATSKAAVVAAAAAAAGEAPNLGGACVAGVGQGGQEPSPQTVRAQLQPQLPPPQQQQQFQQHSPEKPVEVMVRVPRALTPDEVMEVETQRRMVPPARSLQNLAQGVVRMPSAPVQTASGVSGAAATHRMALASHRASVAFVATAQQQPPQAVWGPQHVQQPTTQHLQKPLQPQQLQQHQQHLQVVPGTHQGVAKWR